MKILIFVALTFLPLNGAFGSLLNRFGIEEARVGAEFLWWKPNVDNLDYGYTAQGNVIPLDKSNSMCFQYEGISPKWAPGVRVNFGLPSVCCNWDLKSSVTWIKSHGDATLDAPSDNVENSHVVNTLIHPYMDFLLTQGNGWFNRSIVSDWRNTYVNADLLLSYTMNCTCNFDVSPYFGLAGIWVKQQQNSSSFSVNLEGESKCKTACMTWFAKYWGVGLEAGASLRSVFAPPWLSLATSTPLWSPEKFMTAKIGKLCAYEIMIAAWSTSLNVRQKAPVITSLT